jgi:hypothetical protein
MTFAWVAAGAALGFLLPYGIAIADVIPGFGHGTSYETVLEYMVVGAFVGGSIGAAVARRRGRAPPS